MDVSILEWLWESRGLEMLQKQCQTYREKAQMSSKAATIYTFTHTIDVMLLLEYDVTLGQLVLHHPSSAWPLFQQVCYTTVTSLEWLPSLNSPSQLVLLIRLVSVPCLPGYSIEHTCDLPSCQEEPRFFQVTGTVHSMTKPEKYSEHAVFSCPTEGCEDKTSSSCYISVHVAGASEAATVSKEWSCYTCGAQLVEDMTCRMLEDKLHLMLMPCGVPLLFAESWRCQGICVVVRRELCKGIRPGLKITIIGVPTNRLVNKSLRPHMEITIEANNVFLDTVLCSSRSLCGIPDCIADLLKACRYSPWVFLATLAFSFTADVCPYECYHRLKMALLLSLFGGGDEQEENSRIHLLMYGSDSVAIHQLLTVASSLAPTAVHHNSLNDLVGACRKSHKGIFIDGGSLLLADEGVCTIMNLNHYKKDTSETLQKALETNQLVISVPKQQQEVTATHTLSWKMRCTVWAHADQLDRRKSFAKADTRVVQDFSFQDTSAICKVLADQFDLVIVNDPLDLSSQDHVHDIMMRHVLNQSKSKDLEPPILLHGDLQQYLQVATAIHVKWSERASELLKSYYAASRKVRISTSHGPDVPVRALSSMNAIACAHAKMNLRKEVLVEDAVMAIFLHEESLTSRFGYSVLGLSPCPHFKPGTETSLYIGKEFDEQMKRIHKQIIDFCSFQGITGYLHLHEE